MKSGVRFSNERAGSFAARANAAGLLHHPGPKALPYRRSVAGMVRNDMVCAVGGKSPP